MRAADRTRDPRDPGSGDLPRSAVPLVAVGPRRRPRRRPRRPRGHGRERRAGAAGARPHRRRTSRSSSARPAWIVPARRRRLHRRRSPALRRAPRRARTPARRALRRGRGALRVAIGGCRGLRRGPRRSPSSHLHAQVSSPGAARRAHPRLRVRVQAGAALGRLLPGGLGREGDARGIRTGRRRRTDAHRRRRAPSSRWTRSCSPPASPRRGSPTPSSSAARAA